MRRFPTVSDRGPGFEFFAMFAVLVIWLATLALPASAASKPERVLSGLAAPRRLQATYISFSLSQVTRSHFRGLLWGKARPVSFTP
jgi:hypothetical protein